MLLNEIYSLIEMRKDIAVLVINCSDVQIVWDHAFGVTQLIAFGTAQHSFDGIP